MPKIKAGSKKARKTVHPRPLKIYRPKLTFKWKDLKPGMMVKNIVSKKIGVVCDSKPGFNNYVQVARAYNTARGARLEVGGWWGENISICP